MKNTRNVTVSISIAQVLKSVYAESACLALMNEEERRPPVISSDNRKLLRHYCRNAWLCLAGELAGIVDHNTFSITDNDDATTLSIPLLLEDEVSVNSLCSYAERYATAMVLADCYAARTAIAARFRDMAASALSGMRLAATLSDRKAYWL